LRFRIVRTVARPPSIAHNSNPLICHIANTVAAFNYFKSYIISSYAISRAVMTLWG
jgi:hypothetical protein